MLARPVIARYLRLCHILQSPVAIHKARIRKRSLVKTLNAASSCKVMRADSRFEAMQALDIERTTLPTIRRTALHKTG